MMNELEWQRRVAAQATASGEADDIDAAIERSWAGRWRDCARSYAMADELLPVCERLDGPLPSARCLRTLAWCARWRGDFNESRAYALRALRLLSQAEAPDIAAALLSVQAQVEFCLGDPARALACTERGLALVEALAPGESHVDLYCTQAALYRYQNQTERAHRALEQALAIAVGRYADDEIRVMCNLARLQAQQGNLPAARVTAESAYRRAPDDESYLLRGYLHELLGSVCLLQQDVDAARVHIEAGLQLALDRGDRRLECEIRGAVAAYHAASGDLTRALDVARAGLRVAEQLNFALWEIMYLEQISELHEKLGEYSQALTVFKKYHEHKKAILNSDSELRAQQLRTTLESEILHRESALLDERNRLLQSEAQKRRKIGRELSHAASRDALTGLLNRQQFERKLAELIDVGVDRQHVLLSIDLDQFKIVNDSCGQRAGDQLLQAISQRLRSRLRAGDSLARLGGDEFGVLLHGCQYDAALDIAHTLRREIAEHRVPHGERQLSVTACVGIVAIDESIASAEQAMGYADVACQIAKERGHNRVHRHAANDPRRRQRMDQMQWVNRLHEALDNDGFALYCQPVCRLNSQPATASQLELLLRMYQSNGDLAYPQQFMPAAERAGLMPRIDRWVLAHAVEWLLHNRRVIGDLKLAINVSAESLADGDFGEFAARQIARLEAAAVPIIFEISEMSAIRNYHHLGAFSERMRRLGIGFSLDDFGSGLSSFAGLKHLSVDYLKIDGSFVRDMLRDERDHAIVASINQMAHSMGLSTVAECVESDAIAAALARIGVDFGQGYALGAPALLSKFPTAALPRAAGQN